MTSHGFSIAVLALLLVLAWPVAGQEGVLLRGRITSGGQGVPYATLQVVGSSVGVSCNDKGYYELKLPRSSEADTVLVRSVGYDQVRLPVSLLVKHSNIRLKSHEVELQEVQVRSYRSARYLLQEAVESIGDNFAQQTGWSTFFFRDWRALDDELYVFDEAVMSVQRAPYNQFSSKKNYRFNLDKREMATNFKAILRHRLVVYDRALLERKLENEEGVDEKLAYDDNEIFFDPVSTPQATYMLSKRVLGMHTFEAVQEYVSDGVGYYVVRSVGPCSTAGTKVRYEYVIRKRDLAIVKITSCARRTVNIAQLEPWINAGFDRMVLEIDSSAWIYDQRDMGFTLTRYYNFKSLRLEATWGRASGKQQRWVQCTDWTLTDHSLTPPAEVGDSVLVRQQTIASAFGESDYRSDFWQQYNSILLDALPAQLLMNKLSKHNE